MSDFQEDLNRRFPLLTPIKGPPTLFSLNGFGFTVYGNRDKDEETGTYIKTHVLCALFLPVLALGAYRVADSPEGGWFFLGKEPLSGFARFWNFFLCGGLILTLAFAQINSMVNSPTSRAGRDLKAAQAHLKAGEQLKAANLFAGVLEKYPELDQGGEQKASARTGLQEVSRTCLEGDDPKLAVRIADRLVRVMESSGAIKPLVPDLFDRGLVLIDRFRTQDPESAYALLQLLVHLDAKNEDLPAMVRPLLQEWITKEPENATPALALARIHEKEGNSEACFQALLPHKDRLGTGEGAGLLGRLMLAKGRYEEAYSLLSAYVNPRLVQLHQLTQTYEATANKAYEDSITRLREGSADANFYTRYDAATESEQQEMVENYTQKEMEQDVAYSRALENLLEANTIVPVALDLGIVQLNRAQGFEDPAARRKELEQAEKTFLSIRGIVGGTDEYRMYLGQVYFWLGKFEEGWGLFNQLLADNSTNFELKLNIAGILRDVGEMERGRELVEKVYEQAGDQKTRYRAAEIRGHLGGGSEEQISWLEKGDPKSLRNQISLNSERGELALEKSDKRSATLYLRKAVKGYVSLPKSATMLNNSALAHFSLYRATGDGDVYQEGARLMEEAVSLDPGNSILLDNAAYVLLTSALITFLDDSVELEVLGDLVSTDSLNFLYNNETGFKNISQRFRQDPKLQTCLSYLNKTQVLAPKSKGSYYQTLRLFFLFRDVPALENLGTRVESAKLDFAEQIEEAKAFNSNGDKHLLEKTLSLIAENEKRVSSNLNANVLTRSIIKSRLVWAYITAYNKGLDVDAKKVLKEAEHCYKMNPCRATETLLMEALMLRAHMGLRDQSETYAALADASRYALLPSDFIALLLERGGPLALTVAADPWLQRVLTMKKRRATRYPSFSQPVDWALFRHQDEGERDRLAQVFAQVKVDQIHDDIEHKLSPMDSHSLLKCYFSQKILGNEKAADKLYQEAIAMGMPLPPPS